ncbi:MAG: acyl-CoA dehydrogenase family protein [Solirubrobacterales bacterium]
MTHTDCLKVGPRGSTTNFRRRAPIWLASRSRPRAGHPSGAQVSNYLRRWGADLRGVAEFGEPERTLLLHAGLVGIARGSAREAFAYAQGRTLGGRPLIQLDLLAARLSEIAIEEMVLELQFGRMREATDERDSAAAQVEIRRAALRTVSEAGQVWGGHGFLQVEDPGKRVEAAAAILVALGSSGESLV